MASTRYHLLSTPRDPNERIITEWLHKFKWSILAVIVTFLCTWTITSRTNGPVSNKQLRLGYQANTFRYNRTFGEGSLTADAAWESIFPEQGGFFQHPDIAPKRSGFSVFHQLHCLVSDLRDGHEQKLTGTQDGIRKSYWLMFEAARSAEVLDIKDIDHMLGPAHIRHCIDLLRQSLMCHADLTVEPVDPTIKASTGFGVTHQCKDFSQLMQFMETWQDRH